MITIDVQIDPPYQAYLTPERLEAVAQSVFAHCHTAEGEATLVLTSAEAVQELNRQYRGVDAPTDVLSFAAEAEDDGFVIGGEADLYLGDVIIAVPVAESQAQAAGHAPAEEILLLAIHGLLHLLGYDHHTEEEKAAMWQQQTLILTQNGLGHVKPNEEAH